ncbi:MAG: hypothetical protein ACK55I_36845, partial [bacterium]
MHYHALSLALPPLFSFLLFSPSPSRCRRLWWSPPLLSPHALSRLLPRAPSLSRGRVPIPSCGRWMGRTPGPVLAIPAKALGVAASPGA